MLAPLVGGDGRKANVSTPKKLTAAAWPLAGACIALTGPRSTVWLRTVVLRKRKAGKQAFGYDRGVAYMRLRTKAFIDAILINAIRE